MLSVFRNNAIISVFSVLLVIHHVFLPVTVKPLRLCEVPPLCEIVDCRVSFPAHQVPTLRAVSVFDKLGMRLYNKVDLCVTVTLDNALNSHKHDSAGNKAAVKK